MKKELELYVHIPFCVKKCAYCDFLSFSAKQEEVSAYVEALAEEIKGKKEQFSDYCVTTIFLGDVSSDCGMCGGCCSRIGRNE